MAHDTKEPDRGLDQTLATNNLARTDIEFTKPTNGVILIDQATGEKIRLTIVNRVLVTETI